METPMVELIKTENGPRVIFCVGNARLDTLIYGTWNKPLFVGKDIAKFLGFYRSREALQKCIKPKHKITLRDFFLKKKLESGPENSSFGPITEPSYHEGKKIMIYEPGLYSLAMRSRIPIAEIFQDKIFEIILPNLRKEYQNIK